MVGAAGRSNPHLPVRSEDPASHISYEGYGVQGERSSQGPWLTELETENDKSTGGKQACLVASIVSDSL